MNWADLSNFAPTNALLRYLQRKPADPSVTPKTAHVDAAGWPLRDGP